MLVNFKTIAILLLILSVLCSGSKRVGWPDYVHYPELNGWLKVHTEKADWRTARLNCHNEGALLAGPWTAEFTSTINKLQLTKYPSLPVMYSGLGLRDGSAGVQAEPCDNKRCPVFSASGAKDKVNCAQQLPYACFAPTPSCGNHYEYSSQTKRCYKFHAEEVTWPNVVSICQAEGGDVAKIDSPVEKDVLLAMSDGLSFIRNDDDGPNLRHLFTSNYDDYSCDLKHSFICERAGTPTGSDLRD